MYSVRVSIDYRALGVMDEGSIVWFWIGPHHEYDKLLRQSLELTNDSLPLIIGLRVDST